ncbi:cytoplasmic protein [Fusobacterium nucleatum]|uniref:Cytoplasmic protein n=1 Tax=Fusobacterium nucleatum subsp. polymorphum TaxID=76857 RepID=A0A2C5ZC79_FUSNP|nr:cytoplasmic protein [Fusobacterium polymorphum]PHH97029.1 cytoplasmic protein [Fusobacterium polymorphum]
MRVIFNEIYIFDINLKIGYSTDFKKGINIVTSSEVDGTDRGKSVLLKSLYHALGADARFDSKWSEKDKIYILKFQVEDKNFSIYRSQKLFKIFDKDSKLIFTTIHREELSEFLGKLFNFSIFLPNKKTEQLVLAPPVYSYLLNFLDQDKYSGTNFDSFKNLAQFSNFKLNVLYTHLGVYDKNYFELVKKKEALENEIKNKKEEIATFNKMREKIILMLGGFSCPETNEALENELNIKSKKYSDLLNEMNLTRNTLIDLRNQLKEYEIILEQLSKFKIIQEKEINTILKSRICPECNTKLENTIEIRSKKYNYIEDVLNLKDNINIEKNLLKEKIQINENSYSKLVTLLEKYDEEIKNNKKEIDNYIKFRGLNNLFDKINADILFEVKKENEAMELLKPIKKQLKNANEKTKKIEDSYYNMIDKLKIKFNLNELSSEDYKKLSKNFCAGGSNKPLSTVIWYLTLNVLKEKYNSNTIKFPMIFDSPNNAETDQEKKEAIVQYILDESSNFEQLIISAIGFSTDKYKVKFDLNIKVLKNEKYGLLNKESYNKNYEILRYMNDA